MSAPAPASVPAPAFQLAAPNPELQAELECALLKAEETKKNIQTLKQRIADQQDANNKAAVRKLFPLDALRRELVSGCWLDKKLRVFCAYNGSYAVGMNGAETHWFNNSMVFSLRNVVSSITTHDDHADHTESIVAKWNVVICVPCECPELNQLARIDFEDFPHDIAAQYAEFELGSVQSRHCTMHH